MAKQEEQKFVPPPSNPVPGPTHEIQCGELVFVFNGRGGATCRRRILKTPQPATKPVSAKRS